MKIRLSRLAVTAMTLAALTGSLVASARPARAEPFNALALLDVRPNLKVVSSLTEPYYNAGTGTSTRYLVFAIQNTGLSAAPASTTWVQLEAGDPFSPISTAIAISPYATPALAPGASTPAIWIAVGDPVYIKADIWADKNGTVNETTNKDNHRVHTAGYAP